MRLAKKIRRAIQNHTKRVLFPNEMEECIAAALSSHGLREAVETFEAIRAIKPCSCDRLGVCQWCLCGTALTALLRETP